MIGFLIALVIGFWLLKVVFKIGFKLLGLIFTVIIGLFLIRIALWVGVAVLAIGGVILFASPFQS
ncbi:small multidrug resistance protein [Lactiplantibacillus garii]|uniref:Small multidrug resistance protein n=1 Tax=Lactiplantibacillus garii TaxID=2306423 RepID=A0A3R8J574_9LACO|nr:small multidrug resistance protein [Lactiplantibacillus garii]RRK09348.1 small multidrug resistance protein [Lactiplantibacillus garii]